MTNILTENQLKDIIKCGQCLKFAMNEVRKAALPGVKTVELDFIAENALLLQNVKPTFKNYYIEGPGHYPSSLCVSVNDEIVHGIPTEHKVLKEGDVASFDLGASLNGICTDMAITVLVGNIKDKRKEQLISVTKRSLDLAIKEAKIGNNIGDIGYAIQNYAESYGFGVVREYVGHGIGTKPHLPPHIPNFGLKKTGPKIEEKMALAIEPMITLGHFKTIVGDDGWTVKTADQSLAAHFEHTVVIVKGKPLVVTA